MDYSRQAQFVDRSAVGSIILAGCGSVGRQIGLGLASMGLANQLTIYDHDLVDESNVSTQGYAISTIGLEKVDALSQSINARIEAVCNPKNELYYGNPRADIVIMAVDSIYARQEIVKALSECRSGPLPKLILDARQSPEGCRVIAITPGNDGWLESYLSTLPNSDDTNGCARPQTYYQSLITAGLILQRLALYSRGENPACDLVFEASDLDAMITNMTENEIPVPTAVEYEFDSSSDGDDYDEDSENDYVDDDWDDELSNIEDEDMRYLDSTEPTILDRLLQS